MGEVMRFRQLKTVDKDRTVTWWAIDERDIGPVLAAWSRVVKNWRNGLDPHFSDYAKLRSVGLLPPWLVAGGE